MRGHREEGNECENSGNFLELLQFRVSCGDNELLDHLSTAKKNATYVSPRIQNELIEIIGDNIRDSIVNEIKSK